MLIFKTKSFARFSDRERIADSALCDAIERTSKGLIDADLGGGVLKQRIAREGQGKSGGFRSIILFRRNQRAFFVHGFAKSQKGNIKPDELKAFQALADEMLDLNDRELKLAMSNGTIIKVDCDDQTIQE